MNEIKECEFIIANMDFLNYQDFIKDAIVLKRMFNKLKNKILYKWYIYSNINISIRRKNMIWEYLNGDTNLDKIIKM